jgi:DsbC/DsbD-like thiol-disulfide interchange protein
MRWLFAVLLVLAPGLVILAPGRAAAATSNVFTSREVSLALVSATNDPGDVRLALDFHLAPGWHIYWRYAGDAGFPPAVMLGRSAFPRRRCCPNRR